MSLRQPSHLMLIADRGIAELGPCGLGAARGTADAVALDRHHAAGAGAGRAGITMGEIFHVNEPTGDCAADGVHESMFCAPLPPISKAAGSPIDPMAMK